MTTKTEIDNLMNITLLHHDESDTRVIETARMRQTNCQAARAQLAAAHVVANAASQIVKAMYDAIGYVAPPFGLLGMYDPTPYGLSLDKVSAKTAHDLSSVFQEAMRRSDEHYARFQELKDDSEEESIGSEHEKLLSELSARYEILFAKEEFLKTRAGEAQNADTGLRALFMALRSLVGGAYEDIVYASGRDVVYTREEFAELRRKFIESLSDSLEEDLETMLFMHFYEGPEELVAEKHELYAVGSPGTSVGFRIAGFHEIELAMQVAELIERALPPVDAL